SIALPLEFFSPFLSTRGGFEARMKKKSRRPLKKPFWRLRKKVSEQEGEPSGTPAVDARENAVETARTYFGSKNNPESNRRSARAFTMAGEESADRIPLLF